MSTLYIIASPIGNLEDITLRALRVLREEVALLFTEDTRVTSKLLAHYEIGGLKLVSCNKENESKRVRQLLALLDDGLDVGLISDAGTPLISDPGAEILKAVRSHNLEREFQGLEAHIVCPLPGASSLTTALSVSPLVSARFVFEGFLPHGPKQRRRVLKKLIEEERSIVFFESPHRLLKTLVDIDTILPGREIFVARELSKKFEQFYAGTVLAVKAELEAQFPKGLQGEFVLQLDLSPNTQ